MKTLAKKVAVAIATLVIATYASAFFGYNGGNNGYGNRL